MVFNPILLLNNFKKAHKIVVKNLRICKRIDQLLNNNNVNINKCSELLLKKCLTFQATVLKISHIKNLAFWGIFWESLKTESLHKFNCFLPIYKISWLINFYQLSTLKNSFNLYVVKAIHKPALHSSTLPHPLPINN